MFDKKDDFQSGQATPAKNDKWLVFAVNEFLKDSDALAAMYLHDAIHWRIQTLATVAFRDSVKCNRDGGKLLYLHDASTLKGSAA
jgi:hypothetical protein